MKCLKILFFLVCFIFSFNIYASDPVDSVASSPQIESYFNAGVPKGNTDLAEILSEKTRSIIGRIGCGAENAAYLIIPSLEVDDIKTTSGTLRKVSVAKGSLTLEAVSADNPEMVWHSITIPLKATITGSESEPAEALAKQIQVSDSRFVRFIRVARKKIAEAAAKPLLNGKEL